MIIVGEVKHTSGIYLITNLVNGKVYVGSSINLYDRYYHHKASLINNKHHSSHLQHAYDKYGYNNFTFEVIELVSSDKEQLLQREQYWIDYYNSSNRENGYNINPIAGTTLGRVQSKEEREKRKSMNVKPFLQFDLDGNFIREWSSITEMHNELNIKIPTISHALVHKEKLSRKYYLIFKKEFSNELLTSMLNKKKKRYSKKIEQYDLNGKFIKIWNSIKLASESLNINRGNIGTCCSGKTKTAGGFIWKYAD